MEFNHGVGSTNTKSRLRFNNHKSRIRAHMRVSDKGTMSPQAPTGVDEKHFEIVGLT